MFFFIGGIQPRIIELDKKSMLCPSCGLFYAKIKRTDHYLSIFFIPVLRVKKGEPFMICERCSAVFTAPFNEPPHVYKDGAESRCPHCGGRVKRDYRFCPSCGERL